MVNYGSNPDHARNTQSNCGIRQPEYGDRRIRYIHTKKRGENYHVHIFEYLIMSMKYNQIHLYLLCSTIKCTLFFAEYNQICKIFLGIVFVKFSYWSALLIKYDVIKLNVIFQLSLTNYNCNISVKSE